MKNLHDPGLSVLGKYGDRRFSVTVTPCVRGAKCLVGESMYCLRAVLILLFIIDTEQEKCARRRTRGEWPCDRVAVELGGARSCGFYRLVHPDRRHSPTTIRVRWDHPANKRWDRDSITQIEVIPTAVMFHPKSH